MRQPYGGISGWGKVVSCETALRGNLGLTQLHFTAERRIPAGHFLLKGGYLRVTSCVGPVRRGRASTSKPPAGSCWTQGFCVFSHWILGRADLRAHVCRWKSLWGQRIRLGGQCCGGFFSLPRTGMFPSGIFVSKYYSYGRALGF